MYKLYNVKRWGSMAPHFVLEELGVPYQNIWMTPEQVRAAEFKRLSPLGYIPALGLDDGRVIIESMAIITFLTDADPTRKLAPEPGSDDSAEYLSALAFMAANLYPIISIAAYPAMLADELAAQEKIAAKAIAESHRMFDVIEARLAAEGPFVLGEDYSAADLYLFMMANWARPSERALMDRCRSIATICDHVRNRPKLKAALEAHGVMQVDQHRN